MSRAEVCVDAGLAIKVVVPEPDSSVADALFARWAEDETSLIAPAFFSVETDSILRQKLVLRGELNAAQAESAFFALRALPIEPISPPGHRQRTWEIAAEFGFPTVYDSAYLALAELRGCEFWTADQRLYKRVKNKLSFARWLGDYVTEGGVS